MQVKRYITIYYKHTPLFRVLAVYLRKNLGLIATIFWVVVITSILALLLTLYAIPLYNGLSLDAADALAREGKLQDAVQVLYAPPEEATKVYVPRRTETENGRQPDCMLASEAKEKALDEESG